MDAWGAPAVLCHHERNEFTHRPTKRWSSVDLPVPEGLRTVVNEVFRPSNRQMEIDPPVLVI